MRAMGKLNDRFGVYSAHLVNVIADTTKQCHRSTLQCIYNKLAKANILLRSAFLYDLLLPAKTSSLATPRENTDIITIVNLVGITHEKYIKLEKICCSHLEIIF